MTCTRIDIVIKTDVGGSWLIEQAAEMVRRGNVVRVILPGGSRGPLGQKLNGHGVATVESPFQFSFRPTVTNVLGLCRLRRTIRKNRTQVVMYHLYASTLAARLATVGLKVRRVHMVAGPLFLESPAIRLVERCLSHLDHMIINGCANARERYAKLRYPSHRLAVICYGVDLEHYSPQPTDDVRKQVRAKLGIDDNDFLAIMVAYVYAPKGMVHHGVGIKGHHLILEAWRRFATDHQGAHLLLIGGGFRSTDEEYRQFLIEEFGVAADPTITWLDTIADVRQYYLAADVSVSPSLSEGHGAALEAGAMGVPSIVSDAGGLPEAVTDQSGWIIKSGSVVELHAALASAFAEFSCGRLRSRGRSAREFVEANFDRAKSAASVADVIEAQAGFLDSTKLGTANV